MNSVGYVKDGFPNELVLGHLYCKIQKPFGRQKNFTSITFFITTSSYKNAQAHSLIRPLEITIRYSGIDIRPVELECNLTVKIGGLMGRNYE